jgi:hypothetical protein
MFYESVNYTQGFACHVTIHLPGGPANPPRTQDPTAAVTADALDGIEMPEELVEAFLREQC